MKSPGRGLGVEGAFYGALKVVYVRKIRLKINLPKSYEKVLIGLRKSLSFGVLASHNAGAREGKRY